jgi:hypothetical protein
MEDPMTGNRISADLPQHWLHDPAYRKLSDRAWRLHTHALMWAIGQTDGHIPEDSLDLFLGNTWAWEEQRAAAKELVDAGKWKRVTGGWDIPGWQTSQSTVAQIESARRNWRESKRRQRKSAQAGGVSTVDSTEDSTEDSTGDSPQWTPPGSPPGSPPEIRKARKGKAEQQPPDAPPRARAREGGDRPPCAVPGCTRPARKSCVTCDQPDHMIRDPEFTALLDEEVPF